MLERVDDIGADNPMASNIYMSFVFLAVYQAADSKITVNALRKISHEAISWKPLKLMGIFMNANKPSGINAIRKMMQKNAEWIEMHPQAFYYRDHNDVRSNADYDEKSEKERCKCITY